MGKFPDAGLAQALHANGQGPEAFDEDFEGHQVSVHGQEQQGDCDGVDLGQHRHVNAVGRVDHGGEAEAHLHGDHLAGNDKELPQGGQREAHADTNQDLLQGNYHGVGTEGLNPGHGRDHGYDKHGHQQRQAQAHPGRHQLAAEDGNNHKKAGHAEQGPEVLAYPLAYDVRADVCRYHPSADQVRDAGDQAVGMVQQLGQHPGSPDDDNDKRDQQAWQEAQGLLVYLGRRLEGADNQTDNQTRADDYGRQQDYQPECFAQDVDNRFRSHKAPYIP